MNSPIRNCAKHMKRYFIEEDMHIACEYMKGDQHHYP